MVRGISIKREQVWQTPNIERMRDAARLWKSEYESSQVLSSKLSDTLSPKIRHTSFAEDLRNFVFLLETGHLVSDVPAAETWYRDSYTILARNGATSTHSRLRHLLQETDSAFSKIMSGLGQNLRSAWHAALAGDSKSHSLATIVHSEFSTASEITTLRWCGQILEHRAAILRPELATDLVSDGQLSSQYERFAGMCMLTGSFEEALNDAGYQKLAALAVEERALIVLWHVLLHPKKTVSKLFRGWLGKDVMRLIGGLTEHANFVDLGRLLQVEWNSINKTPDSLSSVGRERTLLQFAAVLSMAKAQGHPALVQVVGSYYSALSIALSDHETSDALLIGDSHRGSLAEQHLPPSGIKRWLNLAGLAASVCTKLGALRFRQLIANQHSERARLSEQEHDIVVSVVSEHLQSLRGPMMKLGQTSSFFGLDRTASQDLSELLHTAKTTPFNVVESEIRSSLGADKVAKFVAIDPKPLGVGSVAQVHRAKLTDGRDVAIKVLHPRIREIVKQDALMLFTIAPLVKWFAPQMNFSSIVAEMTEGLLRETDLKNELDAYQHFAKVFADHSFIKFPAVHEELCSDVCLTMELIDGVSIDDYLKQADEGQKAVLAEKMVEFAVRSSQFGVINTDFHAGNFLVKGHELFAIDFGNVKWFSPEVAHVWCDGIRAGITQDHALFLQVAKEMGLVGNPRLFDREVAFRIHMENAMFHLSSDASYKYNYGVIYKELADIVGKSNRNLRLLDLNPHFVYAFRLYYGLFAMLSRIGAPLNHGAICRSILMNYEGSTP